MNHEREPKRLAARTPKRSEFGVALGAARARHPNEAELKALARALSPLVGVPLAATLTSSASAASAHAGASGVATASKVAVGGFGFKLAAVVVASAGLSAGVLWYETAPQVSPAKNTASAALSSTAAHSTAQHSAPVRALASARASTSGASLVLATPSPSPRVPAAPSAAAPTSAPAPRVRSATTASPMALGSAPSATPAGLNELELIDRARGEVRSAPASALASAAEHERRFPHGAMAEEREVIRIAALAALGKRAEARARGAAFLRANPDTAYTPRIRSLMGSD